MLQNAYFLAKIGADTAENEQQFAEILPIDRRVAALTAARQSTAPSPPSPGSGPDRAACGTPPET